MKSLKEFIDKLNETKLFIQFHQEVEFWDKEMNEKSEEYQILKDFYFVKTLNKIGSVNITSSVLPGLVVEILSDLLSILFQKEINSIINNLTSFPNRDHFLYVEATEEESNVENRLYFSERMECFVKLLIANNLLKYSIKDKTCFLNLKSIEAFSENYLKFDNNVLTKKQDFLKSVFESPSVLEIKVKDQGYQKIMIKSN